MVYPDVGNLVQLSTLMHVTVDYLVKDQDCGTHPSLRSADDPASLIAFRLKASRNTYAAQTNHVPSTRLDSHDFRYEEGAFTYHDSYVGAETFSGEEAIWQNGRAVYAMNYMGRVLDERFSGDFLKEALHLADERMPYRGPEYHQAGEYLYKCKVSGDFTWFQGYEEMYCRHEKVYECFFHGGMIH